MIQFKSKYMNKVVKLVENMLHIENFQKYSECFNAKTVKFMRNFYNLISIKHFIDFMLEPKVTLIYNITDNKYSKFCK